ncbi:MAG: hypothetical protein KBT04_02910 [Bacteroidales bacterium]|nr:hypothetical protein [Candidatus Colimorpha onthohippi]
MLLLLLLFAMALGLNAQRIDSIAWQMQGDALCITYHLDQAADIRVRVSIDAGKTYSDPLEGLKGDVGKNVNQAPTSALHRLCWQKFRASMCGWLILRLKLTMGRL